VTLSGNFVINSCSQVLFQQKATFFVLDSRISAEFSIRKKFNLVGSSTACSKVEDLVGYEMSREDKTYTGGG
jgi:hypothetical protein